MSTAVLATVRRAVDRHPPVVYGPVESRRLGRSLGVNLLPAGLKLCNFDCLYCQCGPTLARRRAATDQPFPTLDRVDTALRNALDADAHVSDICFAGDGEPTMHPDFRGCVLLARELRDQYAPGASVSVLSNASRAVRLDVRAALALADRRIMKLDAAEEDLFQALDRPPRDLRVADVIAALETMIGVETQTMLVHGAVENATVAALDALAAALRRIRPRAAQIMTISRVPGSSVVRPLTPDELLAAAAALRTRVPGVTIEVF